MGRKDTLTKEYMADNHIFADAFNYFMFDGKNVIKAENLRELDSAEFTVPYGMNGKLLPVQKDRDVLKMASMKYDDSAVYLLLGIENQSEIHYAMPVKNMMYDAIRYAKQVDETAKANRKHLKAKTGEFSEMTSGEYLSGFRKGDRLIPVITVVIYFGADPWDGPTRLHEMFSESSETVLSMVSDYKLNLIAPAHMTKDEMNKLTTELREVLLFVKYSKDKTQLAKLLEDDDGFKHLDRKTAQLISVLTNSDFKVEESEGENKVCIAWEGIKADIRASMRDEVVAEVKAEIEAEVKAEVKAEIEAEVKAEVKAEIEAEVEAEVRAAVETEVRNEMAVSMLKSKLLSYEQISDLMKIPVDELKHLELAR